MSTPSTTPALSPEIDYLARFLKIWDRLDDEGRNLAMVMLKSAAREQASEDAARARPTG